MVRTLPRGIYTPLPTFFQDGSEDLDLAAFKKHIQFTASAGTIPVISGTMGEAPHLSAAERTALIIIGREALDEINLTSIPIVAGIGATSTRESIQLAKEAAAAGADFAIAIPPGYYAGVLKADVTAIKSFFVDIAEASPIPVMMYNFPGVTSGIDMDSDLIIDIAKSAPNICGVKLTCAAVGKLTRITAVVNDPEFKVKYPRKVSAAPFLVIDGFIDILLPSMAAGSSGAITGLANFAPSACVKLWELCLAVPGSGSYAEAQKVQNLIANADGVAIKIGIPGMKMLLNRMFGYGKNPRRPLMPITAEKRDLIMAEGVLKELVEFEKSLGTSK
ncbi:putative dihydrodipicolinate synthase [Mollisia scopiformis]|uniref:Putative dihydrodipicolinate synthase n=1 Tax=Mollisia scopiformis TaxID=149040 RepID=A0A194X727_MOLSC|nr:putative dihydrodipicolinate synthase [Mollisia scopiformis]KUJ15975.1 putative dihydrodipicolinate synthase [Mollisia scopiformis]